MGETGQGAASGRQGVNIKCFKCGALLTLPPDWKAKEAQCPTCRTTLVVPAAVLEQLSSLRRQAREAERLREQALRQAQRVHRRCERDQRQHEPREAPPRAHPSVERGSLLSTEHFGRAFRDAFDFDEARIAQRLRDYVAEDESVLMAFSLSGISCIVSILSVCMIPCVLCLLSLLALLTSGFLALVLAAFFLGMTLVLALMVYMSWKNTGFILTDKRVLGRRGVFDVRWVFLTRSLINSLEVNTGLFDRLFGLEKLTIRAFNGFIACRGISTDISQKLVKLLSQVPISEDQARMVLPRVPDRVANPAAGIPGSQSGDSTG